MSLQNKISLMDKIRTECSVDPKFNRAHHMVQLFMAAWSVIIILDRVIGLITHSYQDGQLLYPMLGGAILVVAAFLGTRGHIQGAMMVMQINMAVFVVQFAATCFVYSEQTAVWSTLFYGTAAGVLVACSLALFLNRDLENYRARIRQFRGKGEKQPLFLRTNSRLIRNPKR